MTTTYKQHVPEGFDEQAAIDHVCRHLSLCTHPDDDALAYADEVVIDRKPARAGGHWVVGSIDRDPTPYAEDAEALAVPTALVREAVDLSPEEYAAHMADKAARR